MAVRVSERVRVSVYAPDEHLFEEMVVAVVRVVHWRQHRGRERLRKFEREIERESKMCADASEAELLHSCHRATDLRRDPTGIGAPGSNVHPPLNQQTCFFEGVCWQHVE